MADKLLLTDGTSALLLTDGTSHLLLAAGVTPPPASDPPQANIRIQHRRMIQR